jgi:hypothetical protein
MKKPSNLMKWLQDQNESVIITTPLGRVPSVGLESLTKSNKKINRYLKYQEKRLLKMKNSGQYDGVTLLWCMLLKNSMSYQVLLLHRTKPSWYWEWSQEKLKHRFINIRNKLVAWDLRLMLERFYVIKNKMDEKRQGQRWDPKTNPLLEGEKLRPIGSPTIESAVISKSLCDLVTFVFEDSRGLQQHGYRKSKGVYTALINAIMLHYKYPDAIITEFDFKSFFNKVALDWVVRKMTTKSKVLADLIGSIIIKVNYMFKDLEKEAELTIIGGVNGRTWKPLVMRTGLPQGLSISPLLSTLAMEYIELPNKLIMYADDGIYFGEDEEDFFWFMDSLQGFGVPLEESKTKVIDKKQEFKFLGTYINFEEETIRWNDKICSFRDPNLKDFLMKISSYYGNKPKKWEWNVDSSAIIKKHQLSLLEFNPWDIVMLLIKGFFKYDHKGYRWIPECGVFDVMRSSSYSINTLMEELTKYGFKKKRELKIPLFEEEYQNNSKKKGYYESYADCRVFEGTNTWAEHLDLAGILKREMEVGKI